LLCRCIEIDLQICVGQYNCSNIAPNHHDFSSLPNAALLLAERLADTSIRRDNRNIRLDLVPARFPGNIFSFHNDITGASIGDRSWRDVDGYVLR
jgi:hypothetical protein